MTGGIRRARARVPVGGGSVGVARSSRTGQHGKRGRGGRRTGGPGTGVLVARLKFLKNHLSIFEVLKYRLIIKIITELVCKSRDESNEAN